METVDCAVFGVDVLVTNGNRVSCRLFVSDLKWQLFSLFDVQLVLYEVSTLPV